MRRSLGIATVAAAVTMTIAAVCGAAAAGYPDHPIRVIIPAPPGSSLDLYTRIIGEEFQRRWNQPAILDPHPGAAQNLAAQIFNASPPDGYTLLVSALSPFAIDQHLFAKLNYDPAKFEPVTVLMQVPNVLVVRKGLPVTNVPDFIDFLKAHSGKLTYGSAGIGTTLHLTAEALKARVGSDITHVPYKGSLEVVTELIGERIDMAFVNLVDVWPQIAAGTVRPLAVTSDKRWPGLPDLPAMSEFLPDFSSIAWWAVAAPPNTPKSIVDELNQAVIAAFATPQAKKTIESLHAQPVLNTPAEAAAYIAAESARWRDVIVRNKITAE